MSSTTGRCRHFSVRSAFPWLSRRMTLCRVAVLSVSLIVSCWRWTKHSSDGLDPLPAYSLRVKESHCSQDAVLIDQTLKLQAGATLDVTLRPERVVHGPVSLRTFVKHPQLPPVRYALAGEAQPSSVGTFHLRERMNLCDSLQSGPAHLLFVLSRPSHWLSLRAPLRQVLVLSVEIACD